MARISSKDDNHGSTFLVEIRPHVVHEDFDGEVVILNLDIGLYHALNVVASFIWSKIADHVSPESIVETVSREYGVSRDLAGSMVMSLIREIEREQLVDVHGTRPGWAATAEDMERTGTPSLWPVMDTYRDMRHALVVDPIHEVDESGWPALKVQKPMNGAE